ncbi:type I methionyl aminopeptidase [Paenibacillus sp. Y412MC10]|uniref:type I methionyl aminopeptidase n=1 Tax=Geobacillus sp. (strain Y412MC10) TaxID=481743 RepID=UPI0001788C83|nr:type I methionyl aminopeptidase [Paenibacillus sp. Y412MC10]ACX63034.1 methionine aminopeptidase, type I [Paenibacillus sp. Y412MC10]
MRIQLRRKEEIGHIREAGRILAACHREIAKVIKPGITTSQIDARVEKFLEKNGAFPEQKGYKGFPYATCASVNEVVCHGFPDQRPLQSGDVVTIDMVVNKNGWLADSGWTYAVDQVSPEVRQLMKHTHEALFKGIEAARHGATLGDVGHAIERVAEREGYGIVKPLVGHGIGRAIHEPPDVPNYGNPGRGLKLKAGMVITIEPVFTLGPSGAVFWGDDGWTISSADGSVGVQYEHTIAITRGDAVILTD